MKVNNELKKEADIRYEEFMKRYYKGDMKKITKELFSSLGVVISNLFIIVYIILLSIGFIFYKFIMKLVVYFEESSKEKKKKEKR